MIIFGSFLPSLLVGLHLQSLLGHGSRHCYGIISLTIGRPGAGGGFGGSQLVQTPGFNTVESFSAQRSDGAKNIIGTHYAHHPWWPSRYWKDDHRARTCPPARDR